MGAYEPLTESLAAVYPSAEAGACGGLMEWADEPCRRLSVNLEAPSVCAAVPKDAAYDCYAPHGLAYVAAVAAAAVLAGSMIVIGASVAANFPTDTYKMKTEPVSGLEQKLK